MLYPERTKVLAKGKSERGDYVLYWMQAAQRVSFNHALNTAVAEANARSLPVLVVFGLTDRFPEANARHYVFMLEGLKQVEEELAARGIAFHVALRSPVEWVVELSKRARMLVVDQGYLRIQKQWRAEVAKRVDCPMLQVETEVVVPVETASGKEEYMAKTIRPKIIGKLSLFLKPVDTIPPQNSSFSLDIERVDLSSPGRAVEKLAVDHAVAPSPIFRGGAHEADERLKHFLEKRIIDYDETRNSPAFEVTSNLSPYLHFGQISPIEIAWRALNAVGSEVAAPFIEELVVRRELSMNFTHYNPLYDQFAGLPEWAVKTLKEHEKDSRPYIYQVEELEAAKTHDPYWNAAQTEMTRTGKMHGYMRMYWGKKIIEWTPTPEKAFDLALYLNNKYQLDGRDPNGFTGVAWCFGKHDRAWKERSVFGKIRYMNAKGLERKFDMKAYLKRVAS